MTEAGLDALEETGPARDAARGRRRLAGAGPMIAAAAATFLYAAIDRDDVANYVNALFTRLHHPDLHPGAALVDPARKVPYNPTAARGRRLRPPDDRSLPEPLPALPAADRRRRDAARPQPDHRDHPAAGRPGDRRRPDRRVEAARGADAGPRPAGLRGGRRARPGLEGARRRATSRRGEQVEVLPFLDITNSRNSGVAFGLAEDVSPALIGAGPRRCSWACSPTWARRRAPAGRCGCPAAC